MLLRAAVVVLLCCAAAAAGATPSIAQGQVPSRRRGLSPAPPTHSRPHTPPAADALPQGVRQLKDALAAAEAKLLGTDNSLLDVPGAVQRLLQVHEAVAQRVADTAAADTTSSSSSRSGLSHTPAEHGDGTAGGSARGHRGAAAAAGGAATAAEWAALGRASFTLAALSASGLFAEHLPAPAAGPALEPGQLCPHTLPAGGAASSGSQQHASGCPATSSDPRVLQELTWLSTAAAAGCVEAQMALADRFLMGRGGVATSCPHALGWLEHAASEVVQSADKAGSWDAVPPFIRLRERFMDAAAPQSYSGWDDNLIAEELEAAAAMGSDAYAQRRLGYRRLLGKGMPADPSAAYAEFAAAASDGYAQYNMGLMHLKGWGVRRDPMKALQLFKAALERGVGAAANGIGVLAYNSAQGRADYAAALRWFERGANMSDADSTFNAGTLYLHGLGVQRDASLALTYYANAFDLGHWKAGYAMGQLYMRGEPGIGYDCEHAEKYFWQFLSQRSSWLSSAQAALADHDGPSIPSSDAASASSAKGSLLLASAPRRTVQSLIRHLLLAESGCEAAAENAAWQLLHGQGAGGPRALGLAANLLYRSAILNHTSSMVELAQLLLDESITLHPQQLQQAAADVALTSGEQGGQQLQVVSAPTTGSPAAGSAAAAFPSAMVQPLHQVLLGQARAFLPPLGGSTACTGLFRRHLQPAVDRVVAPPAVRTPGSKDGQQHAGELAAVGDGATVAALAARRSRAAAVAWLAEAGSVGDVEALVTLGWLFHSAAVVQGNDTQQQAQAFMNRAMDVQPDTIVPQCVLAAVSALMWLERAGAALLGPAAVEWASARLAGLRDAVVRQQGMHPAVLELPDGLLLPGARGSGEAAWLGALVARSLQLGQRLWVAAGADRVDQESLLLTCLLGALAGVLWLKSRRQAYVVQPRRAGGEDTVAVPEGRGGGVLGRGGAGGVRRRARPPPAE